MSQPALDSSLPPLPELPPPLRAVVQHGDRERFQALVREAPTTSPRAWLELAHAALQLGLIEQADELLLEGDSLAPSAGLIPDRWGLWPVPEPEALAARAALEPGCLELAQLYLFWRHLTAQPIWLQWLQTVRQQWQSAAAYEQQALLCHLLGRDRQVPAVVEQAVQELVGEEQVEVDPATALAVWAPICRAAPSWSYARLKAADLSLKQQQLNACAEHLAAATAEQRQLPWLWDIEARLAVARQQPREALRCWEEAIRLAGASGDEDLAELMRQRRREAEWDAEWMAAPQQLQGASGDAALDRFAERLETWAQRAAVALPGGASNGDPDPDAFAAFLDQASGRLALAG